MSELKLSVIVPIYNVEPYLRKCVDSLLAQDLPRDEYEIILVDDGSPDNCGAICDEYAKQCGNVVVIHQTNGGLSAARNSGLKIAKGKYIQFVDSDDYLQPNVFGELVAQMERENLDVLRFDYQNVHVVNGCYEVFQPYKHPHIVDRRSDVTDGITYLNERMEYTCYAWQFMICKRLLMENEKIVFRAGINFEDVEWTPRMLLVSNRVNSTTTLVYDYLLRDGSITYAKSATAMQRNLEDQMLVVETLTNEYAQYPQCEWLRNMRSVMVSAILTALARNFYGECENYIVRLRQMQVFPLSLANQGKTYTRRASLINTVGARLYCLIYHLL